MPEIIRIDVLPFLLSACQKSRRHEESPFPFMMAKYRQDMLRSRAGGLLVLTCGERAIRFAPALTIRPDQAETAVAILADACAEVAP